MSKRARVMPNETLPFAKGDYPGRLSGKFPVGIPDQSCGRMPHKRVSVARIGDCNRRPEAIDLPPSKMTAEPLIELEVRAIRCIPGRISPNLILDFPSE